jgi:hypothetical protein
MEVMQRTTCVFGAGSGSISPYAVEARWPRLQHASGRGQRSVGDVVEVKQLVGVHVG